MTKKKLLQYIDKAIVYYDKKAYENLERETLEKFNYYAGIADGLNKAYQFIATGGDCIK